MTVMLLEWVFTSTFLILVVLALRALLGKRIGAGLRYAMWAVVLVRLLIPVQLFTSPVAGTWVITEKRAEQNIYTPVGRGDSALPRPDGPTAVPDTSPDKADGPVLSVPDAPTLPDAPSVPESPAAPDLTKAPAWLGWTWLAGGCGMALVLLASNLRFARRLRRCRIPLEGADCPLRVYAAVGLPSPCLFGMLRPAIYITPETAADPAMLRHVTAHELTHYRHLDHIWNVLRCAALAVHWWNPLVWLAVTLSRRDGELSCDEGALKRLGDGERAAYGNTLLALVTAKPRPGDLLCFATTMAGDKKSLRERITRIAAAPRRWMWAAVAVVLVTALACACAFGQKAEEEPADDPEPPAAPSAAPMSQNPAEGLAMDVSFSLDTDEEVCVRIDGSVGGVKLPRGAFWRPAPSALAEFPDGYLTMVWPAFTDGIEGHILAGWADEGRTSVTVSTKMMAMLSSYFSSGYWAFTVDLSGEGTVTEMEPVTGKSPVGVKWQMYPEAISDEEAISAARVAAKLLTAAEDYYLSCGSVRGDPPEGAFDYPGNNRIRVLYEPDFNRNGIPETVVTAGIYADWEDYSNREAAIGQRIGVFEDGKLIWWDEGYDAHTGWNAIFSCTLDGEEYLLRYHPTMFQGVCEYSYELFTLENGRETVVKQNSVEFDTNFHPLFQHHSFEAEAIAAFMEEVNGLLASGTIEMITDQDLIGAIVDGEPGLKDNLWWLDGWEPVFVRDENKSLLENLKGFQAAMEREWYTETPTVNCVNEETEGADIWLSYRGKNTRFTANWDYNYQPAEQVEPRVVDLNGDGKDEIVVILVGGHGTGVCVEGLYLFDAETLEQYDTSTLTEDIIAQIKCTGDKDNFYLSAPGMERVAIDKRLFRELPRVADTINLGYIVYYKLEDGAVFCTLGCDASGIGMYCGHLQVRLAFDGSGFRVAGCTYEPSSDYALSPYEGIRQVLLGEEQFTLVQGGNVTQTRKYLAGFAAATQFAVVEPAGGEPAVVLKVEEANGAEGYLFLYEKDGTVYGVSPYYIGSPNSNGCRVDLKTDGTLVLNAGPGRDGEVWAIDTEGYFRLDTCHNDLRVAADRSAAEFFAEGRAATEEEYRAALEKAAEKKDAVWFRFWDEAINNRLS